MAPSATAKTAARASIAAVPMMTRTSVSTGAVSRTRPWFSSFGTPTAIETTAAISPVTKATAPITTALAASTAPRRGVAASVVRIRPRRYSELKNIAATTMIAISPRNAPARLCSIVTVGSAAVWSRRHRRDVAGASQRERAAGNGEWPGPCRRRAPVLIDRSAAADRGPGPRAAWCRAGQADAIEDAGGLGGSAIIAGLPPNEFWVTV